MDYIPDWLLDLEPDELSFIKNFILNSGSLKEVATIYEVIQKIEINDSTDNDPYIRLIKRFAVDERIDYDIAKQLITAYRDLKGD